jgi:hypothetical protein
MMCGKRVPNGANYIESLLEFYAADIMMLLFRTVFRFNL